MFSASEASHTCLQQASALSNLMELVDSPVLLHNCYFDSSSTVSKAAKDVNRLLSFSLGFLALQVSVISTPSGKPLR